MLTFAQHAVWRDNYYAATLSSITCLALLFTSHWSLVGLQHNVKAGRWLRRVLLPVTLYFLFDVMLNRGYTLGSSLRDTAFLAFGWHFVAKTLDVGLVYDIDLAEGKPLPRWCVPDWDKEEAERKEQDVNGSDKKDDAKPALYTISKPVWWQRSMQIRKRPQWAIKEKLIPRHWRLLPLPTTFADQALWVLDVMYLRIVGTSLIFTEEMRALDWSMKKLVAAGQAQHQRRLEGRPHDTPDRLTKDLHPFGFVEMPLVYMLADFFLLIWAYRYYNSLNYQPTEYSAFFKEVPFLEQVLMTMAIGTIIAMAFSPIEFITIPLMANWPFHRPLTSLAPAFRDVSRSQSISEMWGWRWHKRSQRDFIRLSRLIPIGGPENRVMALLKAFYWSGIYHSLILLRDDPPQTWSRPWSTIIRPIFFRAGTIGFFMTHALLCLFETAAAPFFWRAAAWWIRGGRNTPAKGISDENSADKSAKLRWQSDMAVVLAAEEAAANASYMAWRQHWRCYVIWIARIVWVWGILIWTGRWLAAETYAAGYMERENIASMGLRTQIEDHLRYLRESLPFSSS